MAAGSISPALGRGPRAVASAAARTEPVMLVAALAWAAGLMHMAASAEHLSEWPAAAMFFAVLAAAQLAWGAWAWARPSRPVLTAGALVSAAVALLWAVTRTVGLPVGPDPWTPEAVGALDLAATVDEVLLVAGVVALLRGRAALLHPVVLRGVLVATLCGALLAGGHPH